jgi:hypothetical protein
MGYLGYKPADKPLTAADITDSIITSAKITDATIVNGDIANSTIALAKLSATGTPSAATFLRGDNAWGEAGAAAGQVIQVLTATDSTQRTTTSSSFVTASNTLSVTITPSAAANKILVICSHQFKSDNIGFSGVKFKTIFRGATNIGNGNNGMGYADAASTSHQGCITILDSPNTTSAITYQFYMRTTAPQEFAAVNSESAQGSMTCMEIKG